jgi:xylulokinase
MDDRLLIGIDVGTTAVKAALFDSAGGVLRAWSDRYPMERPGPGLVEQNPYDWILRVETALAALSQDMPPGRIAAAGLTSQVNTHVFVDATGAALMNAIVWQDGRCAEDAAALTAKVPETDRLRWWGAPLPIDASHVLARMAYVARVYPDVWRQTRWVMAPKDFCLYRLTGIVAADPMTSFGVVDGTLAYISELIGLVPGAAERLPPLSASTAPHGSIGATLPAAGTPMVTGTMDAWAGLFGAGVCRVGEAVYLGGTSEVLGIVSDHKVPTPGVIAFPKCDGVVLHAGPTQAGGASIEWLSRLLGQSPEALSDLVASSPPRQPAPVFLPHLAGERAPLWDITSRASFAGLDATHGPADIARAVFEGVGYSARWLLDSLEQSADLRPDTIHLAGGSTASDIWCQIRADVLGRPLRRTRHRDAGTLGAAILAGTGCGLFPSIDTATRALVSFDRTFEPRLFETDRHAAGFSRYRDLYHQLKDWNRNLQVAMP